MKEEQKKSLSDFFKSYISFIEIELYNSLLEISVGRCNGILYEFLKVVHTILQGITEEENKKLLEQIENVLNIYEESATIKRSRYLKLHLQPQDISDFIDKDFMKLLDTFFVAINDFRQILPKIPLDESIKQSFNIVENKEPTFTQALLEFNNALSHIAISIYHQDKQDSKANIKKAKAHLYRGSLDCYKMLIRFLLTNKNLSENILETYKKTRIQELCALGGEIRDKLELIDEYKEIVNKLMTMESTTKIKIQ